ncbi:MAG TPA: RIP metalloprotease RseP [Candidatus Magasanikbacteria bacterium]|nr:RIP metalloprotease RseP [Candidatus Magasanikbacteria bacterium]
MVTILLFIIILGILVVVHEWGHYYTAKKFGIKVHEFGFGYPPRAFGWYRDPKTKKLVWIWGKGKSSLKETVSGNEQHAEFPGMLWSINWLPLGGFVRIKGENGERAKEIDSFGYHKAWKRIIVLAAGVIMNFILAAVVLGFGFMIGLPTDLSEGVDTHAIIVESPSVIVESVEEGLPADVAGIIFGDKITSVDRVAVSGANDLIEYIKTHRDNEVTVHIVRGQEELDVKLRPTVTDGDTAPRLGIAIAEAGIIRYPWYIAIYKGFLAAGIGLATIFVSFYYLIVNLVTGQGLMFDIAGPVGIAQIVGQSAKLGFHYVLNVVAMLSLSLAAINVLPIPALDGGRILFIVIEKIIGRPVSMKYEQLAHTIGFVLLMALVVVVTWRDIAKLF